WQRERIQGQFLESELAYWKEQLAGELPVLKLPTDRPRPAVQTANCAEFRQSLSKPLTDALYALSKREGVTLFMTLLAAFKTLLYRYTGDKDVIVAVPITNRSQAELERLIGMFVNTLALRTVFTEHTPFRELLGRV